MNVYLKQIEQLLSLQKVDDEIHGIQSELDAAPVLLEKAKSEFNGVSAQRERQLDKMAHLEEQEKRLGIEIDDEGIRLKKSKNKLMQASNSKEYHAMVREMDSLERSTRGREEEKTALIDEVARQREALEEIEVKYQQLKSELAELETGTEQKRSEGTAKLQDLSEKRGLTAREVPGPVFTRYEFIRKRLAHPVIVPVEQGICSGCNIAIPPQNFIELQKGQHILSCPNCQRLMYWSRKFVSEAEQPQDEQD